VRHLDGHWVECEVNGVTVQSDEGPWLVLAIRSTGDRDEVMGRRRSIEQLIRLASLECSSVPWQDVEVVVNRYLRELASVIGAELIELATIAPIQAVWGNTDAPGRPDLVERIEETIDGVRIVVTHGHEIGSVNPPRLVSAYMNADVIVYGHTHVQLVT
jgi:hypothetical protein